MTIRESCAVEAVENGADPTPEALVASGARVGLLG